MALLSGNLLAACPEARVTEVTALLAGGAGARVERVVSHGQASPPGFWYDQDEAEFVAVVAGRARLRIEGEADARQMAAGDWIVLPPHCRHRVDWTDPDQPTVWLAVFYRVAKLEDEPQGHRDTDRKGSQRPSGV